MDFGITKSAKTDWDRFVARGIEEEIADFFPVVIGDDDAYMEVDWREPRLGIPPLDAETCMLLGVTWTAPLTIEMVRTVHRRKTRGKGRAARTLADRKRVKVGDIPIMHDSGFFVVNGSQKVHVTRLERAPGLSLAFAERKDDAHDEQPSPRLSVTPERGSRMVMGETKGLVWLSPRYETQKVHVTDWLMALGMDYQDVADAALEIHGSAKFGVAMRDGQLMAYDTSTSAWLYEERLLERRIASQAGQLNPGTVIDLEGLDYLRQVVDKRQRGVYIHLTNDTGPASLFDTLADSDSEDQQSARLAIWNAGHPGRASKPSAKAVDDWFESMFLDEHEWRLCRTGMHVTERKLGLKMESRSLTADMVLAMADKLVAMADGREQEDDTFSLENRVASGAGTRTRRSMVSALERWLNEMKTLAMQAERRKPGKKPKNPPPGSLEEITLDRLANAKHINSAIRTVFSRGSDGNRDSAQLINGLNPLAALMNVNRTSMVATSGGAKSKPVPEARYIKPSHFRRLSPIESPDGKMIGLVNHLSLHTRTDKRGFLCIPVWQVNDGVVDTSRPRWLDPTLEKRHVVAFSTFLKASGRLSPDSDGKVEARTWLEGQDDPITVRIDPKEVTCMDVARDDFLSVAGSLVPFIEHSDSTRGSFGAMMLKQAVPCVRPQRAHVTTGREEEIAEAVGDLAAVRARHDGVVVRADAQGVTILHDTGVDRHPLPPQATLGTGYPRYRLAAGLAEGSEVEKGDLLADGPATHGGGVALGQNVRVAYMTWHGLNYEDAIVISSRLAESDQLTSLHTKTLVCRIMRTKNGDEELTADLPNRTLEDVTHLDENGVAFVGAELRHGDTVIGKATPVEKREVEELSPFEKLQKLFDPTYGEYIDTSLTFPPGMDGAKVVSVRVIEALPEDGEGGVDQSTVPRAEKARRRELKKQLQDQLDADRTALLEGLVDELAGKKVAKAPGLPEGGKLSRRWLQELPFARWGAIRMANEKLDAKLRATLAFLDRSRKEAVALWSAERRAANHGVEMDGDIIRLVVVKVAYRRPIQAGDKLAGRHGNKGVVSLVVPVEDMPFDDETGEPVDMLLNPLGVPSRMNVGQILETHLGGGMEKIEQRLRTALRIVDQDTGPARRVTKSGKVAKTNDKLVRRQQAASKWLDSLGDMVPDVDDALEYGATMASPAFDGVSEKRIRQVLAKARLPVNGQRRLRCGRTGELFDRPVTVGSAYVLKLNHMVEDKVAARSRGTYYRRTQQPKKGRPHGGQRFGEMEFWALEAYGAVWNLLETMAVKSDDVAARARTWNALSRGADVTLTDSRMLDLDDPDHAYEQVHVKAGGGSAYKLLEMELHALGLDLNRVRNGVYDVPKLKEADDIQRRRLAERDRRDDQEKDDIDARLRREFGLGDL